MKKIILIVLLVGIAGVVGVVRSHSRGSGTGFTLINNPDKQSSAAARDEIRKSYNLSAGARVEGWVVPPAFRCRTKLDSLSH